MKCAHYLQLQKQTKTYVAVISAMVKTLTKLHIYGPEVPGNWFSMLMAHTASSLLVTGRA